MNNREQIEYWNGEVGERWAQQDDMMARLLQPVAEALLDHAGLADCRNALDVGCGGGSQSLLLAQRLGAGARVLGVDISGPLLAVARERAASAGTAATLEFLQADASTHEFGEAGFDALFSRFGVMFFDDPVAAFGNLHGAMAPAGRLAFCCWQPLRDNPWTWLPLQVALRFLPPPAPQDPHAPGPFAFADPQRVESILGAAGFSDIAVTHHEFSMRWAQAPTLQDNVSGLLQIGPVARLLADQDAATRERIRDAVVEELHAFYDGEALCLPGAVWFVTAAA